MPVIDITNINRQVQAHTPSPYHSQAHTLLDHYHTTQHENASTITGETTEPHISDDHEIKA